MRHAQLIFAGLLTCLFINFNSLVAQSTHYVIAPSGLSVRATPSLKGKLIGRVAFGDSLNAISDVLYGTDSLYTATNYGYFDYETDKQHIYGSGDFPITTRWLKINYQSKEAYVAAIYTSRSVVKKSGKLLIYLDRNSTTWGMSFNPVDYQWYGLFYDSTTLNIKNIEVDFIEAMSETSGAIIESIYANKHDCIGIIGSKKELKTSTVAYEHLHTYSYFHQKNQQFEFHQLDTNQLGYGEEFLEADYLYAAKNSTSGEVVKFLLDGISSSPGRVRLVADIDGDQINDYILFCYTIYDVHENALFLSSNMKDGVYYKSGSSTLDFD